MSRSSKLLFFASLVCVLSAMPLYAAEPQEVAPSGYKLLVFAALLLLVIFLPARRLFARKTQLFAPRLHARLYSEGKGISLVYVITLSNRSRVPIELDAPYLHFSALSDSSGNKTFRVRPQGAANIFPLALYPGTSYAFRIPLARFAQRGVGGPRFRRMRVEVQTPEGRVVARMSKRLPRS